MVDLKFWLREQGLTVRELALELEVPHKTVQEGISRRGAISGEPGKVN